MRLSPASRVALMELARAALRQRIARDDAPAPPEPADPELIQPAGCFVSLHERSTHRLRGCVGRLHPTQSLWQSVRLTAADVLEDPRFALHRVSADDIPELELEISVLSEPRLARAALDFDPPNDGIYLICGERAGFFLPQVARETGWSREQLLARLCTEKMGLPEIAWKLPDAKLYTFEVEVIGPEPL